jgi:hypothetical protein
MTEGEAETWRIENRRLYFHAFDGKSNLAPPADKRTWFRLEPVSLGNATAHRPGDSVAVVTSWQPPDVLEKVTVEHMNEVRRRVAVEDYRVNEQAKTEPLWIGVLVADVVGLNADDKGDRATIKAALKRWFANGVLTVGKGLKDSKGRDRSGIVRPGKFND